MLVPRGTHLPLIDIGLGCMRLSTAPDRDERLAIEVIHAALDGGVTLLDSADAYAHGDSDIGHNERLVAEALRRWAGDRSTISVATKGGLRRPKGAWVPDGRAKHLREACEASRRALGVERIDLYQLHAVDPKVEIETSVRALAALRQQGLIRDIGLCNVTVDQIERARRVAEIASVQVSLSPFDDENFRNGVAEYCRDNGIRLIAHRPLGGERVKQLPRDPLVAELATRCDVTAPELMLAWLVDLGLVPIPGATRVETARSIGRAPLVALDDETRERLDARFSGRLLRVPRAERRPKKTTRGDVVVVMGMPGAGKSTLARELESQGYERLNRDVLGGSLDGLVPRLDGALAAGKTKVVLDNTYPTRAARNDVIETAWQHGIEARCIWLDTSIGDAQINAIERMLDVHGALPSPAEIRVLGRKDPRYLGPDAQFRYERTVEPPREDEGWSNIERRAFSRPPSSNLSRAILLDADDLADEARLGELRDLSTEGWLLFAHAWRPGAPADAIEREFAGLRHALGIDIELAFCDHEAGPPVCWCRKPIPGRALEFARRRAVALDRSIVVGRSGADRTMAQRLGAGFASSLDEIAER